MIRTRHLLVVAVMLATALAPLAVQAQGRGGRGPVAVGSKLADGQAYATVVELKHQPNATDNGKLLLAFEANGWDGIPIWESTDQGANWHFVMNAQDSIDLERPRCNLHWQPHLTEVPRAQNGLAAGTVLLSASTVCQNPAPGRGTQNMKLRLYSSADIGRSWNYISTYAEGTGELPVWEPHLVILDNGTFVQFFSSERHKADGYNQLLSHKISKDGGKSWGPEIYDTAMKGGVERPGMVITARLPDGRYVYNYEAVAAPDNASQVYLKFSRDGMNWGNPGARGTPVRTMSGQYPTNTPNVFWFPIGGPKGVLVVTSRSTQGGANDVAGNSLFWNNNLGVGPWWQAPTPVQKIGNNRAGWTQAMVLKKDGSLLHITSSGSRDPANSNSAASNEILFNAVRINFNRYEAENAGQKGTALMRDASMSNGVKSRLGAGAVGALTFTVHVPKAGRYDLAVTYADIGFAAQPRLAANGQAVTGSVAQATVDPALAAVAARDLGTRATGEHHRLSGTVNLKAGDNSITIAGGQHALDIDYLDVNPL